MKHKDYWTPYKALKDEAIKELSDYVDNLPNKEVIMPTDKDAVTVVIQVPITEEYDNCKVLRVTPDVVEVESLYGGYSKNIGLEELNIQDLEVLMDNID